MATEAVVQREIQSVRKVIPNPQGPHHTVGLVLEPGNWAEYDPFLMLAEDWFETGTFAVHPHRGIETVTYVIEGQLNHYDNRAGAGELLPGDVQWMTAGRGVMHQEDPEPGQRVHSLQLWVNLPREHKLTEPRYQNLRGEGVPVRQEDGALIRVFSGSSAGVEAKTLNYVPVTMVELNLDKGASVMQDLPGSYNGFIYVLEGKGVFGSNQVEGAASDVLWLGPGVGGGHSDSAARAVSAVSIHAKEKLRALLYAGEPLREPVAAYGPFVMNTEEEIRQAFRDYQNGLFDK